MSSTQQQILLTCYGKSLLPDPSPKFPQFISLLPPGLSQPPELTTANLIPGSWKKAWAPNFWEKKQWFVSHNLDVSCLEKATISFMLRANCAWYSVQQGCALQCWGISLRKVPPFVTAHMFCLKNNVCSEIIESLSTKYGCLYHEIYVKLLLDIDAIYPLLYNFLTIFLLSRSVKWMVQIQTFLKADNLRNYGVYWRSSS